jgi:hypothetical protein
MVIYHTKTNENKRKIRRKMLMWRFADVNRLHVERMVSGDLLFRDRRFVKPREEESFHKMGKSIGVLY